MEDPAKCAVKIIRESYEIFRSNHWYTMAAESSPSLYSEARETSGVVSSTNLLQGGGPIGMANPARSSFALKTSISLDSGFGNDEEVKMQLAAQQRKKAKKKKNPILINVSATRYQVVREVGEQYGTLTSKEDDLNCYLFWSDAVIQSEKVADLKPYQRVNHFPGMGEICRKDCLARNMMKMVKAHPDSYSFVPKTWILPGDYTALQNYALELKKKRKHKTFIVKPANGAMGHGICLYRSAEKIPQLEHMVVQEYIDKPYLIDGYKFDLRVYILMTSCDPLRIFLFNDGLVRMSTEPYSPPTEGNIDQLYMHLTNYSINKKNDNFDRTEDISAGSKRSLQYLKDMLRKEDVDVNTLWKNIADILVKTILVAEPHVLHNYRMCRSGQIGDSVCFEILGFDIMLDRKLRPWLIEINRAPSYNTDTALDYNIKYALLNDTFRLLNMKLSDKRKGMAAQKAETQKRLMRPSRRSETDMTDFDRRKANIEKRKEELRAKLAQVRKENAKEDYENRNIGHFQRIFPPVDKAKKELYERLLSDAFQLLLSGSGKASSWKKDVAGLFPSKLQENTILDMLEQCDLEAEDNGKASRGPKPLSSMPTIANDRPEEDFASTPKEGSDVDAEEPTRPSHTASSAIRPSRSAQRPRSARPMSSTRRVPTGQKSRSLTRPTSSKGMQRSSSHQTLTESFSTELRARQEESTRKTLDALNEMKIKFPGKTDEEAKDILDQIMEHWKYHKPRIASYWLVKLDSIKRRKVIDIVRTNVKAVLQRTWKCSDVESIRIYRIVSKVFNRLLWSHGQGLWNCFSSAGDSWETMFSKSSDNVTPLEMSCCRRVVQLCRDCLLIVYQFAAESRSNPTVSRSAAAGLERTMTPHSRGTPIRSLGPTNPWSRSGSTMDGIVPVSQKMSRLYPGAGGERA